MAATIPANGYSATTTSKSDETPRNFRKGLLVHLILVSAWVLIPIVYVCALFAVGAPHGWPGILASIAVGVGLLASNSVASRTPLIVVSLGMAAAAPTGRALALFAASFVSAMGWSTKGGKSDFARRPALWEFLSRWRADYYAKAVMQGNLEDIRKGKSCFAFHPHGCLSAGFAINGMLNPDFIKHAGKVNWLLDFNLRFKNPVFRAICDSVRRDDHAILGADKQTFSTLMADEESIAFIPGGFQDAVVFTHNKDITVLHQRKGFIKYCLQFGYRLHPVYTFGECQTFHTFTGFRNFRLKVTEFRIPMAMFFGWPVLPFLPRPDSKIVSVLGPALDLPHLPTPSAKEVDYWHGEYTKALKKLFYEKREEAGWPDAELEIL